VVSALRAVLSALLWASSLCVLGFGGFYWRSFYGHRLGLWRYLIGASLMVLGAGGIILAVQGLSAPSDRPAPFAGWVLVGYVIAGVAQISSAVFWYVFRQSSLATVRRRKAEEGRQRARRGRLDTARVSFIAILVVGGAASFGLAAIATSNIR
jgi:hypothetical protein